ncbi:MAG: slipin family protein [Spirochaetaceae bacterium]
MAGRTQGRGISESVEELLSRRRRRHTIRGHFQFNALSVLALVVFLGAALGIQFGVGPTPAAEDAGLFAAGVLVAATVLILLPYWPVVLVALAAVWGVLSYLAVDMSIAAAVVSPGLLIAPGIEIIRQWDKIVVLRLGKFHRVKGPGPMYLVPILDSIGGLVDTRIRVTDFSAEQSLTRDTVPVNVDALCFWMVWDAQRAILEVQDFEEAVVLSAQTALRAGIGANDLSALLSERERLGREIQQLVDAKTNPWGISILSVEFKEILVPEDLQDALSREAQAIRERSARMILSRTETEISEAFVKAGENYKDAPKALELRAMAMIYESIRSKGGLVLVPSDALKQMNLGTVLGAKAYVDRTQGDTGADPPAGAAPEGGPDTQE